MTAVCLRVTAAHGRSDLEGVMFGIAVDGINRTIWWDPKEFLVHLDSVNGGAAVATVGGASPEDTIRLLYDADANTLTYYRKATRTAACSI